jgi:hypothetical protein
MFGSGPDARNLCDFGFACEMKSIRQRGMRAGSEISWTRGVVVLGALQALLF